MTVQTDQDADDRRQTTGRNGYPATLMLQDGGVIDDDLRHLDDVDGDRRQAGPNTELPAGLPELAEQALTRVIKNG